MSFDYKLLIMSIVIDIKNVIHTTDDIRNHIFYMPVTYLFRLYIFWQNATR